MTTKATKKLLALALSLALLVGMFPSAAFAAAEGPPCENHPEHTAECGYVEAVEGQPCGHVHDESCGYAEGTPEAPCGHIHDEECGYAEAVEGRPCAHACELCAVRDRAPGGSEPTAQTSCALTGGCTLPDGHEGGCETAPPANDAPTVTGWTWIDPDENLNGGGLALPGVSIDKQADFDTVISMLPAQISAEVEGEADPATVNVTGWTCDTFTRDAEGNWPVTGTYTFAAELETGYALASSAAALEVKVLLGGGAVLAANDTITEDGITVAASNGGEVTYTAGSGFTLNASGSYTISGEWSGSLSVNGGAVITVPDGVTANVKLSDVAIDVSGQNLACAFLVAGGTAHITLSDANTLKSSWYCAGLQVPENATVTIDGTGSLEATGGYGSAGIGGGTGVGGSGGSGGTITISGGEVTAIGGNTGAGIGGGFYGNGGTIEISGGTVTATGGNDGAGIGGGQGLDNGGDGGTITITGGEVAATGNSGGAGIGGGSGISGSGGSGGTITITGGTVTATGGSGGAGGPGIGGAGIGGGYGGGVIGGPGTYGGDGGIVTISGPYTTVTATGSGAACDVGSGNKQYVTNGSLSVTDGATLEMTNTGTNAADPEYKNCTIIDKDKNTTAYDESGTGTRITPWDGQSDTSVSSLGVATGGTVLLAKSNTGGGATLTVDVDGVTITSNGQAVSGVNIVASSGVSVTIRDLRLTAQKGECAISFADNAALKAAGVCAITGGDSSSGGIGMPAIYGSAALSVEVGSASLTAAGGECTDKFGGGNGILSDGSLTINVSAGGALTARGGDSQEHGGNGLVGKTVTIEDDGIVVAEGGKANGALSGNGIGSRADMTLTGAGTITARGSKCIVLYDGGTLKVDGTVLAEGDQGISFGGYTNPSALTGSGSLRAIGGANDGIFAGGSAFTLRFTGSLTAHGGSGALGDGLYVVDGLTVEQAPASLDLRPGPNGHAIQLFGSFVNNSGIPDGVFVTGGTRPVLWPAHLVTVDGGAGGGYYGLGETVTITATVPGGQRFTGWTISPGVTFTQGGKNTETAAFTMPAQAVTATAHYETVHSSGGSGDSGPSYYRRTLTEGGVKVTGGSIHESAALTAKPWAFHSAGDAGCDLLRAAREAGHLLGAWDVSLSRGFRGSITVSLPVEGRDGQTLTVAHCVSGKLTLSDVKVSGGFAAVETDSLSPFAVLDGAYTQAGLEALAAPNNPSTGGDNPFTDVKEGDWFYEAVLYVYHRGIMQGTGETAFSPYGDTTRAQLAAILWRLEGSPAPTGGNSFTDVPAGQYYTEAVVWCSGAGLMDGYGGGRFGPLDPITREQLAAALYRYAGYKGWDVSMGGNTNILSYADAFDVSEWAIPAVQWACGAGLMNGTTDGRLNPQGKATRAELAAMLMRALTGVK